MMYSSIEQGHPVYDFYAFYASFMYATHDSKLYLPPRTLCPVAPLTIDTITSSHLYYLLYVKS